MPLPLELQREPDETTVVGDVDALVNYIESGQAYMDWQERIARQMCEFDKAFPALQCQGSSATGEQ